MRRIAHISDVHFGREDPLVVKGLLQAIAASAPDLVVVSGDLTQRARVTQFQQAREFLDALPDVPRIVVPGNHDISATNLVRRMVRPMSRYRRYISKDLQPFFVDPEIAVVGVNTVRALSTKDGRINRRQVTASCARFHGLEPDVIRIVITHHPMDLPASDSSNALVGRAAMAMEAFAGCRVDLFLSGHLHTGQTVATSERYLIDGYSAIVAQAGTAVSTRTRGEGNSWNLIEVSPETIDVRQMVWQGEAQRFVATRNESYRRLVSGWSMVDDQAAG
jgi:3',5'-cyclic AMP phosphodiesterase CpdA